MQTNNEVCKVFQAWHYMKTWKTPKINKYNKILPIDNTSHTTTMVRGSFFKPSLNKHLQQGDFETTPPNNIFSQTIFVANACNQKMPTQ